MKWYADPSHAWLKVSLSQYPQAILFSTGFGYISPDKKYVYLEEDCEAPAFLRSVGVDSLTLEEKVYPKGRAPLTNYEHAPRLADFGYSQGTFRLELIATGDILVQWQNEKVSA